ncbi:MAG: hypothetical protein ACO1RT_10185 [Planctomycetaceae bacterium]
MAQHRKYRGRSTPVSRRFRRCGIERLESRSLLAGDVMTGNESFFSSDLLEPADSSPSPYTELWLENSGRGERDLQDPPKEMPEDVVPEVPAEPPVDPLVDPSDDPNPGDFDSGESDPGDLGSGDFDSGEFDPGEFDPGDEGEVEITDGEAGALTPDTRPVTHGRMGIAAPSGLSAGLVHSRPTSALVSLPTISAATIANRLDFEAGPLAESSALDRFEYFRSGASRSQQSGSGLSGQRLAEHIRHDTYMALSLLTSYSKRPAATSSWNDDAEAADTAVMPVGHPAGPHAAGQDDATAELPPSVDQHTRKMLARANQLLATVTDTGTEQSNASSGVVYLSNSAVVEGSADTDPVLAQAEPTPCAAGASPARKLLVQPWAASLFTMVSLILTGQPRRSVEAAIVRARPRVMRPRRFWAR